jgi:rhamnosyltransferase subunit B
MDGRVVIVTHGSFGDVNPFVGVARELKRRGYRPVIISAPIWHQSIVDSGIECDTFESGWDIINRPEDWARCFDPDFLVQRIAESYEELMQRVRSDDVLLSLTMMGYGPIAVSPLVAESRDIKWAAAVLEPLSFFSSHEMLRLPALAGQLSIPSIGAGVPGGPLWWWQQLFNPMTVAVQALRQRLKLKPMVGQSVLNDWHSADLVLALFSEVLARPQPDWPERTKLVGFISHDGHERMPWPKQLEDFLNGGLPPIVFTFSSDAVLAPDLDFCNKCLFAARAAGRRAVITGLTLPEEAVVPNGSQDVCFVRSASFASLFPRAAAIVHHAGIGTSAIALRAGKPMLLIPGDYAQPDIAARLEGLGVARVLPRPLFRSDTAATELGILLGSPSYARAAERVAAVVKSENGARAAGDAIEVLWERRN